MTADIELLPLPEWAYGNNHLRIKSAGLQSRVTDYASANVAHATAPLQAEIEALREERDSFQRVGISAQDRVVRLAEALQKLAAHVRPTCSVLWDEAQAALRDHDENTE